MRKVDWDRLPKDSITYQGMLRDGYSESYKIAFEEGYRLGFEEGCLFEAQRTLLRLGEHRFGKPSAAMIQALELLPVERLEESILRLLDVGSWDDLLAE